MYEPIKAVAQIRTFDDKHIIGYIEFVETPRFTLIKGYLKDENKYLRKGKHGMHIHEKGDPRKCCDSLGGHYNPFNKSHGCLHDDNRHLGDLGNIEFNENGECIVVLHDKLLRVSGEHSIIGRSIVIHENADDCGRGTNADSKKTGNSGKRIAYGIIGHC